MTAVRASCWLTPAEIATRRLPGLPTDKRAVNAMAAEQGWANREGDDGAPLARRRTARGGGMEYHVSLLPEDAQELVAAMMPAPIAANDQSDADAEAWAWYDQQSASTKAKAERRMAILAEVERRIGDGAAKTAAIEAVARRHNVSARSVAGWLGLVTGRVRANWLPCLAPQYKSEGTPVEVDAEAWRILKSDYLRPEKPTFAACYNRVVEDYCRPRGIELPCRKTLERRMKREVSKSLKKSRREGREALRRTVPPQLRSVADLPSPAGYPAAHGADAAGGSGPFLHRQAERHL